MELNKIYCMDNVQGMIDKIDDNSIDLTVTSPPYDDIRNYNGYSFDFENVAKQLFRITKEGGVLVWIVGDSTIKGSETLTSFNQAIYFKSIGFNVWDTMIYNKNNCPFPSNVRYNQMFEYMFVFSKGKVKTFNPLKESKSENEIKKIKSGSINFQSKSFRNKDGSTSRADSNENMLKRISNSGKNTEKTKGNVWTFNSGYMVSSKDKISFEHPATFPEKLVEDHILSWSNPNDLVLDPFFGSGTTGKIAKKLKRNYIGFEISQEYCDIAEERCK